MYSSVIAYANPVLSIILINLEALLSKPCTWTHRPKWRQRLSVDKCPLHWLSLSFLIWHPVNDVNSKVHLLKNTPFHNSSEHIWKSRNATLTLKEPHWIDLLNRFNAFAVLHAQDSQSPLWLHWNCIIELVQIVECCHHCILLLNLCHSYIEHLQLAFALCDHQYDWQLEMLPCRDRRITNWH